MVSFTPSANVCTKVFKENFDMPLPAETAAQKEEREALEEKEVFIEITMQNKGVSREVAEAEYNFFSGRIQPNPLASLRLRVFALSIPDETAENSLLTEKASIRED